LLTVVQARPEVPQTKWKDYRYYPVDAERQWQKCTQLGLSFVKLFNRQDGRTDLVLIYVQQSDGNYLFRTFSHITLALKTTTWEYDV